MKYWRASVYGLGIIPLIFSISLLAFYFHSALIIGRFPTYGHPDPKSLGIYVLYSPIVYLASAIWMCSLILWLITIVAYIIAKRKQIIWQPVIIGLIAHVFAILLVLSRVMEWFVD